MTRRIAWAILLTCWTVLLAGGFSAYFLARQTMLAELDEDIISDALALPQLAQASGGTVQPSLPPGDRFLIVAPGERIVARSEAVAEPTPPRVITRAFVTLADGVRYRTVTVVVPNATDGNPGGELRVVYRTPAERFDNLVNRLAWSLAGAGGICAVATALVARRVSRQALAPIRECADAVGAIDPQTLHRRVDTQRLPVELLPVADRLNDMLRRLEDGFARQQRFLADAAHELRTPIAALLTSLEVTLRRPRDAQTLLEAMRDCLSDTVLLKRLADALLQQARAAAPLPPELQWIELTPLFDQCVTVARTLASERDVQIEWSYPPALSLCTDAARMQSILTNLLSNAVEYNVGGGRVRLEVRDEPDALLLRVGNTGPGIAADQLPLIFEPFRRQAASPNGTEHLGLGLHLVQTHVESLGGACRVTSEAGWTEFEVRLPRAADAQSGGVRASDSASRQA